jgi:hypothetical protein
MQGTTRKKKARALRQAGERRSPLLTLVEQAVPAPVRAIAIKDFLVLRRDLRSLSQLVTPLILGIVYTFMLVRGGNAPQERGAGAGVIEEVIRNAALYGNVGIAMFVGWSLLSRLAGMGFSAEGKSYWMLKASPVSGRRLLTAKFLVAYLPTLILGWSFLVVIALVRGGSLVGLLYGLAVVALSNAGLAGLNLAFGVVGANFDWEDPRRMNAGSAGCLGAILSMVYIVVALGCFILPPVLFSGFHLSESLGRLIGLFLGGLVCLAAAFVPLFLVRDRLARLNE